MANNGSLERTPLTPNDISNLKTPSERAMAQVLIEEGLVVYYEPEEFRATLRGNNKGTRPDFLVKLPGGRTRLYLEITESRKRGSKSKQRQVMQENQLPYEVWYRDDLKALGRQYPEIDFGL